VREVRLREKEGIREIGCYCLIPNEDWYTPTKQKETNSLNPLFLALFNCLLAVPWNVAVAGAI